MTDNNPQLAWSWGDRFRAAHEALSELIPPDNYTLEDRSSYPDVVDDLPRLVRLARDTAAASLGPTFTWWGDPDPKDRSWPGVVLQADFDDYRRDVPQGISEIEEWEGSALDLAARAYRRECRFDHSPGEAGVWLLSIRPHRVFTFGEKTSWSGTLAAFAILYDRDVDGSYETLGHIWTAQEWRRQGLASELIQVAQERFSVSRIEDVTSDGRLLLEKSAPEILAH